MCCCDDYTPPTRRQKLRGFKNRLLVRLKLRKPAPPLPPTQQQRILKEIYEPLMREEMNRQSILLKKIEGKPSAMPKQQD